MKNIILALVAFSSVSAFAADENIAKVEKLSQALISGQDTVVNIQKTNDPLCGAAGPTYVATVSVRTYNKSFNEQTGEVSLVTKWKKIRTYGIPASEINSPDASLMAQDQCLE